MAYILSIDTSTPACSAAIHKEGILIGVQEYNLGKSHSSLLPVIIDQLLKNIHVSKSDLSAVAICSGPGSYTGLRIGASVAKGLCYALEIPLIVVSSLQLIADYVITLYPDADGAIISSLDARRDEVYTYAFSTQGKVLIPPKALILDENSYAELSTAQTLYIAGDGATKTERIVNFRQNTHFLPHVMPNARQLGKTAYPKFEKGLFEDIAYFEPFYLKEFYTTQKLKN